MGHIERRMDHGRKGGGGVSEAISTTRKSIFGLEHYGENANSITIAYFGYFLFFFFFVFFRMRFVCILNWRLCAVVSFQRDFQIKSDLWVRMSASI